MSKILKYSNISGWKKKIAYVSTCFVSICLEKKNLTKIKFFKQQSKNVQYICKKECTHLERAYCSLNSSFLSLMQHTPFMHWILNLSFPQTYKPFSCHEEWECIPTKSYVKIRNKRNWQEKEKNCFEFIYYGDDLMNICVQLKIYGFFLIVGFFYCGQKLVWVEVISLNNFIRYFFIVRIFALHWFWSFLYQTKSDENISILFVGDENI